MDAAARHWYLVYSKPRQEQLALENLARQGYEAYLPLMRNRRRRGRKWVSTVEPMFPRYLFVHLDTVRDNWAPIRSTIGVSMLVRFGPEPARVPDELIELFRQREDESGVQRIPPPDFRPGDRVRIVDGPFAGYEAIYQARSGRERVEILLRIAGRTTRVQIAPGALEPAV